MPYANNMSRNVNSNWKAQKVVDCFSDFAAEDLYEKGKANREKLDQLAKESGSPAAGLAAAFVAEADTAVVVKFKTHTVRFDYEKNTKFIEKIDIILDNN